MTNLPPKFITSYYFKCTYCGKVSYSDTSESPSMCGRCLHKTAYHDKNGDKQKINPEYVQKLEAENEELKAVLNIRSCQNCRRSNRTCPSDESCKNFSKWEGYENLQLIKAKEIMRIGIEGTKLEFLFAGKDRPFAKEAKEMLNGFVVKAEQFLKEVEK